MTELNNKSEWIKQKNEDKRVALNILENKSKKVGENMKELINYLNVQSRFDMYSTGNCLLILSQKADAIFCKDEANWRKSGNKLRKRDEPIIILEPTEPIIKDDGTKVAYYNSKRVYDISSTDAVFEDKNEKLSLDTILSCLLKSSPIKVNVVDNVGIDNKYALYNEEENILNVCRGKDVAYTIEDIVMEVSKHLLLQSESVKQETINFKSTCVSYMFCKKYQIPFPTDSFEKLPNELSGNPKEIREELNDIRIIFTKVKDNMVAEIEKGKKAKEQVR